ncbi:hypothetical protein V0P10_02855 [Burkholderia stagnalis]
MAACLLAVAAAACGKSDSIYASISTEALNYLPYNLIRFTVIDQYGNKARGGGDLEPGAGEGSIACCYLLKGTDFKVRWTYYDADDWRPGERVKTQEAEANVSLPPTKAPDSVGSRILEIHFYPDRHVELAFPGEMLGNTRLPIADCRLPIADCRLPIVDVSRDLTKRYGKRLDRRYEDNDGQLHRRIARAVAEAWLKYRFTDRLDLEQYAYYTLLVNPRFDAHPDVQKLIQSSKGAPGAFANGVVALSPTVARELEENRFDALAVPPIQAGQLPPARVEGKPHG